MIRRNKQKISTLLYSLHNDSCLQGVAMKKYQIFSDSACDTPQELLNEFNIDLIPFYVTFDQETYYKETVEITPSEFYQTLKNKRVFSQTSLPSVQDYINKFKPVIQEGKDVLCLCLSQKFSGSYQSAVNAKEILEDIYKEAKITVIDSIQATAGQGLLLLQAGRMQKSGYSLQDCAKKIEELKSTARIMFTVDDLEYLSSGGRIGKVASLAGNMLNLKPLIKLKEAELIPYTKVRGRLKALDKILSMVEEHFHDAKANYKDYDFCLANATTMEDALHMKHRVESLIGRTITTPIFQIGATIGTYVGPGALGVCFVKRYDA